MTPIIISGSNTVAVTITRSSAGKITKTGQQDDTLAAYRSLEKKLLSFAPRARIDYRWSGQVIETNDGLPLIGETAPHQFTATGFSGNGMTFGTLGAMMAVDAELKRENPWQKLFDVHRKRSSAARGIISARTRTIRITWCETGSRKRKAIIAVTPGRRRENLNLNGRKVAAHRDATGKVTLCSPVCTHLQCIVGWNNAEKTWDCPCHGARFKPTGEVISGPAEEALPQLNEKGEPEKKSG